MDTDGVVSRSDTEREYVAKLLSETREDIGRADAKSGMVLAALGIGVSAVLGGLIAGDWEPADLHGALEWLWWIGGTFALLAVAAAAGAVWPRYRSHPTSDPIYYWGDRENHSSLADFAASIDHHRPDPFARDVEQLWVLSGVVLLKYSLIQKALVSTAIAVALCGLAVAISAML